MSRITSTEWTPSASASAQAASPASMPPRRQWGRARRRGSRPSGGRRPRPAGACAERARGRSAGPIPGRAPRCVARRACGPAPARGARGRRPSCPGRRRADARRPPARPAEARPVRHRPGSPPDARPPRRRPSICCCRSGPGRSSKRPRAPRGSRGAEGAPIRTRLRREGTAIGHEARPLRLEHLPDRSLRDLGVAVGLRPCRAAVGEPGVELLVALRPNPGREEAPPDHAHLVLDLPLLPAGGGRAGHGFDEIVAAHLLEAPVAGALPAREDRVHRGLRSAGDPSTGRLADPPRCRRSRACRPRRRRRTPCRGRRTPSGSARSHLEPPTGRFAAARTGAHRLAGIGPHEHHPAVAEPDMRPGLRPRSA